MKKWILFSLLFLSNEVLATKAINQIKVLEAIKQSFKFSRIQKCQGLKCYSSYSVLTVHNGVPKKISLTPAAAINGVRINSVRLHFDHDQATIAEQKKLIQIALSILKSCWPESQIDQRFWNTLAAQPWEDKQTGWQDLKNGALSVGYSGYQGLTINKKNVTGLTLQWPKDKGRCTF